MLHHLVIILVITAVGIVAEVAEEVGSIVVFSSALRAQGIPVVPSPLGIRGSR